MFVLLDKHRDIGFFDSWDFPKHWIGKRFGPFLLTDIVNNVHELEELIQDLEKLELTEQIIYSSKYTIGHECPKASYVHNLEWRNSVFFVEDKKVFEKNWETYINAFKSDQLSAMQNYWAFSSHKGKMLNIFSKNYLLTRKSTFSVKVETEPIRYFEFLWVLQQEGICIINDIQCQDKKVFEQTDKPIGSVLHITLTEKGLKQLQSFIEKFSQEIKEESVVEEKIWRCQHAWKDWVVNRDGLEICYKNILVDFKRARKAYKLLRLLIESDKGEIPLSTVIKTLEYTTDRKKINSWSNIITNDEELIRSKINNLGRTIHKKVLDTCKKEGKEANFYISVVGEVVKIHPNSF